VPYYLCTNLEEGQGTLLPVYKPRVRTGYLTTCVQTYRKDRVTYCLCTNLEEGQGPLLYLCTNLEERECTLLPEYRYKPRRRAGYLTTCVLPQRKDRVPCYLCTNLEEEEGTLLPVYRPRRAGSLTSYVPTTSEEGQGPLLPVYKPRGRAGYLTTCVQT
jgi:hypothetical protein